MYRDTVTVFNRRTQDGRTTWYPTTLTGVDLNADRAKIVARFGETCTDRCLLHVRLNGELIAAKRYLEPKAYADAEDPAAAITFAAGEDFSFFCAGEYANDPIDDAEYTDGFYNHLNAARDDVFVVAAAARYSVIPHLEIVGR